MSKVEAASYKAYPYNGDYRGQCDSNSKFREAYIKGYLQAEIDLELTWEDIAVINNIVTKMLNDCGNNILYDTEKDFCQEVLKHFKERKGK